MTVRVKRLNSGISGGPVTFFADNFNRAGGADLGFNWMRVAEFITPINSPWAHPESFLTGTAMTVGGSIQQNNPVFQVQGYVIATPTRIGTKGAVRQFSQATCTQRSGPQAQLGLCVQINDDNNDCYSAFIDFGGGPFNINIGRTNAGTFVGLAGPFGTIAPGDVLRVSADASVAGTVTIRVSKNGTQVGSFADNTGSRLTTGYTGGFYIFRAATVAGVTDTSNWDDFSCGIGL